VVETPLRRRGNLHFSRVVKVRSDRKGTGKELGTAIKDTIKGKEEAGLELKISTSGF